MPRQAVLENRQVHPPQSVALSDSPGDHLGQVNIGEEASPLDGAGAAGEGPLNGQGPDGHVMETGEEPPKPLQGIHGGEGQDEAAEEVTTCPSRSPDPSPPDTPCTKRLGKLAVLLRCHCIHLHRFGAMASPSLFRPAWAVVYKKTR